MRNLSKTGAPFLFLIVLLATSCMNPFGRGGDASTGVSGGGSVEVAVATLGAASIVPDVAALVSSYTATLSREGFADVTRSGNQTTFSFPDVAAGRWNVMVEALDENDQVIGRGTATVEVSALEATSVAVSVEPTSEGSGGIDITVTWPLDLIEDVDAATLTPIGSDPIGITAWITEGPTEARYVGAHQSGVYELRMVFQREGVQVATLIVAVQVYDNVATAETIELTEDEIGQPPTPPADRTATGGDNQVTLTWTDASPINDNYELQRKREMDSIWQNLTIDPPLGGTATEYVDNTAVGGTTYNYRIRGTNSFGPVLDSEGWVEFNAVTATTPQLDPPTLTPPDPFVEGGKILLSTNKPNSVRYYYTKDGQTDPTFDSVTLEPGPNTFAVWQYEGIVLNSAGTREIRVLARSDGWLTSGITTQTVTVVDGTIVTNDSKSGAGSLFEAISNATAGSTITFDDDYTIYLGAPSAFDYYLDNDITIDGGSRSVTIDGGRGARHFELVSNISVTIRNIRLWRGKQSTPNLEDGGSIYVNSGADLTLENVHFDENGGGGGAGQFMSGGAIYNDGGTVTIKNTLFEEGTVNRNGGALANTNNGTVTIRDSRFVGNRTGTDNAFEGGGAIYAGAGTTTTIINSLFAENRADNEDGGAIKVSGGGEVIIQGSLFAENYALTAGAIYIDGTSSVQVANSVFANNSIRGDPFFNAQLIRLGDGTADVVGSSFINQQYVNATSIVNSAFGNNDDGDPTLTSSASQETTHSIGPGLSQTTNLDEAAEFVRAPGPGPDGSWGTDDDDWGDMRLVAGSGGIDAGNNDDVSADSTDVDEDGDTGENAPDYAGNVRIGNGTVDMGAAER